MEGCGLIIICMGKCLNTCKFCSGIGPKTPWESLIKAADQLIEAGVTEVEFGGLDPGEHPRLVELINYMVKNGKVTTVYLETHGRTLKDEAFVKSLADTGVLKILKIPLYGATEEVHNQFTQIRNSPGNAFQDVILGLNNCAKYHLPVQVIITPTQYNKETLNDIIKLALDATNGDLRSIIIRPFFITDLKAFGPKAGWYLPMREAGPYLQEVLKNHPSIPHGVIFGIEDTPYCVVGKYSHLVVNAYYTYGEAEANCDLKNPNMGIIQHDTKAKGEVGLAPSFRKKAYFEECGHCSLQSKCYGIYYNELILYGAEGLKAIKAKEAS